MGFTGGHTGDERHAGEQRTFSEWSEGCVRGQTSQIFVAETSVSIICRGSCLFDPDSFWAVHGQRHVFAARKSAAVLV